MRSLKIFSPAKINLYLHITGKRHDGYHLLNSLVTFVDIGDWIRIEESPEFELNIEGSFSNAFTAKEKDSSPDSQNLIARAAWGLSRRLQRLPTVSITLTKNLPLGAGIGGGSANAAATIWGLLEWWDMHHQTPHIQDLLLDLGADVPVCFGCETSIVESIGESITHAPEIPEIPILVVFPGKPSKTENVFRSYVFEEQNDQCEMPPVFDTQNDFIEFLRMQKNHLSESAIELIPEIAYALEAIENQDGLLLSRMTGSGSSCFGLFSNDDTCIKAAENIIQDNPNWWVRTGYINRPKRY